MAASLLLTVGAVADPSLTSVFRPFLDASKKAQRSVEGMMSGAASSMSAPIEAASKKVQGAYRQNAAVGIQAAERVAAAEKKAADAKAREHERALAHVARIKERYFREDQARDASQDKARRAMQERVGSAAMRHFGAYASRGVGMAKDIAQGFGVDLSLAGGIARSVERNSTAIAVSNAAYKEGGPRESVAGLESQALAVGGKYAMDPNKVLAGLAQYQKLTGDLATGKASVEGLTALAGATTTELDHMLAAAGNVGNALGNGFKTPEEKAKAILEVMKGVAAFGQEGAVEVSDLSTQMAKVAAAAGFFEGDRSRNILEMTALAQLARASGGASSATQAATSVQAFANTLRAPARRAQFDAMGVKIDSEKEKGQLRPIFDIIKDSIAASGGDLEKMKKMFANVVGDKGVTALLQAYNKAGGGKEGMKAVDAEIGRFSGTMSDAQIAANNAERMKGDAAQAMLFQVELDKITSGMARELAPAMKELAPVALDAAKALAGIVSFGAQNPGAMIVAAIGASIAKAAIGEAVTKSLAGLIGKIGMGAGVQLGALTLLATTAYLIAQEYEENVDKSREDAKKSVEETIPELLARADKQLKDKGSIDKETIDEIARRRADIEGLRGAGDTTAANEKLSYVDMAIAKLAGDKGDAENYAAGEGTGEYAKGNKDKIDALAAKMDQMIKAFVDSKPKGPLDVNIVGGMPAPAGPGVDPGGRTDGVK